MLTLEDRVETLESVLGQFIVHSDIALKRLEKEMRAFKDEIRAFKDEIRADTKAFKDEMKKEQKRMNKQWSELAKKMGTIVEDIIAPAVRPALKKYFTCEIIYLGQRIRKRISGQDFEVDLLAVSDDYVFMIEEKSTPKIDHVDEIIKKGDDLIQFFPEYADKKPVLIFASIVFPEHIVKYASRKGIYVMAYKEWDYVDILNFNEVVDKFGK